MDNLKEIIAGSIKDAINNDEIRMEDILNALEEPKDSKNGDMAFPCFKLSRVLKNSPINIAQNIKENIKYDDGIINKVENVNGYLNFYINNASVLSNLVKKVIEENDNYGKSNIGGKEKIVIDYSSPNIAKPFHLGHFRNTVLGASLYNLYNNFGYEVVGINHLGDWGRQFGLLIEGYKLFKDEYDIENDALGTLSDIYVRISKLAKEDEAVMERARQNFKELEDGNEEYKKLWEYFREISLKEYNRIYDILGCKFDSYNGEAFYNDKMDEVVEILEKKGVLEDSQGAKVVNVGDDMPPCIILKSNGSTIYATRDLAAILYRARTYNFKKAIYITGSEQILHFKQVFAAAKYLVDEKYQKGLIHIPYGMIRLKTGKMSTREGNVIYVDDLIKDAISKSKNIIREKNSELENLDDTAKIIGVGALIFNYLKTNKQKDIIFDLDETLRFDGETGPYVQYTYVRTKSIIEKSDVNIDTLCNADYTYLKETPEVNLLKQIEKYEEVLKKAMEECEPAHVARYLIDISTLFSRFYNECRILNVEDTNVKNARLGLTLATGIVIKNGLKILGINCPDKM